MKLAASEPGGRWLNQDFMDFIYTLYVNGINGMPAEWTSSM